MQDNSGASEDDPRYAAPSKRHHPKFHSWCHADQVQLRDWSRSNCEEIGWIEHPGEQVYHTPAHNALALRMVIDQITSHFPKDNEDFNVHVKHLEAMLDTATVANPVP
jgi:hypothetical protein